MSIYKAISLMISFGILLIAWISYLKKRDQDSVPKEKELLFMAITMAYFDRIEMGTSEINTREAVITVVEERKLFGKFWGVYPRNKKSDQYCIFSIYPIFYKS